MRLAQAALVVFLTFLLVKPEDVCAEPETTVIFFSTPGRYHELRGLSIQDIFFRRRRHWSDGYAIKLILLPYDHRLTRAFAYEYLGTTSYRYKDTIESRMDENIVFVQSESDMIRKVISTPGAIGYIGISSADQLTSQFVMVPAP